MMYKFLNKVFSIILNIMIIIVLFCLGIVTYNFVQVKVLDRDFANYFGYTFFQTISGSMEPSINIDDFVFVKVTKNVELDDVISFKNEDMVITHRIIEINGEEIVTKGDANNTSDKPINKECIIGKVVYVGKNYGKFIKVITAPIVFIPFLISILLFNWAFSLDKKGSVENEKIC